MSSSKYEPPDSDGVNDEPAQMRTPTTAESATARLAQRRVSLEQQRQAADDRRFRDDARSQVFARGDRRRAIQTAEGRLTTGQATQRDAHLLQRADLNDTFERQHGDLLADDRAAALAQTIAARLLRDAAYAHASAGELADVIAQATRRELAATMPAQSSQTTTARSQYVDQMRGQRARGTPSARGGLKNWK